MSKVKLRSRNEKLTEDDISNFQLKYNVVLPENYKKLISKINGGIVENSDFMKLMLSIKYGNSTVDFIIETHQILEKNIAENYLPMATDWSGNVITINLQKDSNEGKIYAFYFDVDRVEVIANSLEELLGVKSIDEFDGL
jgi:hypothetical protein